MVQLKTADQMLDYCDKYDTDGGALFNRNARHFELIEDELKSGEFAVCAFTGLMNGFNYAFAITADRVIYAQKKIVGSIVKSIYLKNINDVTARKGPIHGFVEIDTLREKFEFCVAADYASSVRSCIRDALNAYQRSQTGFISSVQSVSSTADELLKFKQLLDIGAITADEFNAKKNQLLNL